MPSVMRAGRVPYEPEHRKLAVYRKALQCAAALDATSLRVPERRGDLRDQLKRASASLPLNIAEGAGEFSPRDKARFYRIARRSATECSAVLDLFDIIGPAPCPEEHQKELAEIGAMLTAMVRTLEARPD